MIVSPEAAGRPGARGVAWPRLARTLVRAGAVAASVAGLLTFVLAPLQGRFTGEFEDFRAYHDAGSALNHGTDPYAAFVTQTPNVALTGFDYPPLVAWLCRPLGALPEATAATLWLWLGLGCTVAGCLVVMRSLLPARWPRTELAMLTSMLFGPALYNLWHGQMNPVVFLLLALGLRAWVSGRQTACGAWLGLAASIKLAPAVLLLLFVRRRWWRGLGAAALVGAGSLAAGTLTVGTGAMRTWVTQVLPVLTRPDGWLYNQSWSGVVNRAADHSVLTVQGGGQGLRLIALGLSAAGLAAAAWAVRPGRDAVAFRGGEYGAGLLAMLLAGTITWYAHYVIAVIPLAAAAVLVAGSRGAHRRALGIALGGATLTLAVAAPLLIAQASMTRVLAASRTGRWWPLLQLCSAPALSAAALLVALVVVLRTHRPVPADPGP